MPDDLLESLTAHCAECSASNQVTWCPAWGVYLCVICRSNRNDTELRMTLAQKVAFQEAEGHAS